MTEEWRDVPGYEGSYFVSNEGRVKSLRCMLKLCCGKDGYYRISLWKNNKCISTTIHSIVLLAFKGAREKGMIIRHLDGDIHNNKPENLRYGTQKENEVDKLNHGKRAYGDKVYNSKITIEQAIYIYENRGKKTQKVLALELNISKSTVNNLWRGETWVRAISDYYAAKAAIEAITV